MKKIMFSAVALLALSACSDEKTARRALDKAGFTQIETHGWSIFGCSQDDTFSTKFVATNANGKRVAGVVCNGFLTKGATIRFD